jgi:ATP-binding protein involved in chromosome partitioning
MAFSREDIIQSLRQIKHPGTGKDIVTLGIVREVVLQGTKVTIHLLFPKQKDPFAAAIQKACVQAVKSSVSRELQVEIKAESLAPEKKEPVKVLPGVKNIIAVASGKGGVGKSTITVNLAVALAQKNLRVGLIDADIFGPSIPKMLESENEKPTVREDNGKTWIQPVEKYGIKFLSIGLFVNPEDALVWRGPMATNALRQLIHDGEWGELDFLLFDLPPGTSDIHLTLVQEAPVTGAVIVSTPQKIALVDTVKGINMFQGKSINVPVLGLVENMAWFTPAELPKNKYYIFGKDGCKNLAKKMNVPLLGEIPIVQSICESGDSGHPVALKGSPLEKAFSELADNFLEQVEIRNKTIDPTKKVEINK